MNIKLVCKKSIFTIGICKAFNMLINSKYFTFSENDAVCAVFYASSAFERIRILVGRSRAGGVSYFCVNSEQVNYCSYVFFYREPTPTIKQVPVGFFRTFTYQPYPFNAAAAPSPYYNFGTSKLINPLQFWPQKAYTQLPASSLSSYNGPLQAQGSVNQQTREPSPLQTSSIGSSGTSTASGSPSTSSVSMVPAPELPTRSSFPNSQTSSPSSSSSSNTPIASIAESLTSDTHLPASPTSNTPVQPTPYSQLQYSSSAPLAPMPASQQFTYPPTNSGHRPLSNNFLPTDFAQLNLPYMMAGAPMPIPPVQFVPCMCPVSYGMTGAAATSPEVLTSKRAADDLMSSSSNGLDALDETLWELTTKYRSHI